MTASGNRKDSPPESSRGTVYVENPERELVAPLWDAETLKKRSLPGVYIDKTRGVTTFVPDRVERERNLRDDPLGQMHDRRQIEEHQYRAGRQFQDDWEVSGRSGRMRGMDTTQEPVDGGRNASSRLGVTDRSLAASRRLNAYETELGAYGWRLATLVLVDKRTLRECAQVIHGTALKPANVTFVGHRFRECLDTLAERMGLRNR